MLERLEAKTHDLGGGLLVRRLLPSARRRAVGPFVFFDHFGPATFAAGNGMDVRPHPHIGLATVSYLLEGAIEHRDSLGIVQRIEPGAINLMTAGRGIVHSERSPAALRSGPQPIHGLQLWMALPRELEECDPAFEHVPASAIPSHAAGGAEVRVLVGEAFGLRSPVPTASPTQFLDLRLAPGATLVLESGGHELALYPVDGVLEAAGEALRPLQMAVIGTGATRLHSTGGGRAAVIGGAPLDGHRHMWWNFVSTRRERIDQAAEDWRAQRMGAVPGETEFIPLP